TTIAVHAWPSGSRSRSTFSSCNSRNGRLWLEDYGWWRDAGNVRTSMLLPRWTMTRCEPSDVGAIGAGGSRIFGVTAGGGGGGGGGTGARGTMTTSSDGSYTASSGA